MAADRFRVGQVVVAAVVGVVLLGGAQVAHANPNELTIDVLQDQATLAPDGRSITFGMFVQCDRKSQVLEARATVVQPQASGEATFTPICNRLPTFVEATVPALGGSFVTGEAQVSARLLVREGRTKQVQDAAVLRVRPSVSVILADRAVLTGGGDAVQIDVTVTCPVASIGRGGQVTIYQSPVAGTGTIAPTACDGLPHTQSVTAQASGGEFRAGAAEAFASATVEDGGEVFPGSDFRNIQIS
ncbi:MAG: hypothetical protein ACRDWG_02925 [Actinomycetes bacterium]|jgi:hypothetical protein|nr:hypothetical protein [Actinomycetes bacterium]